MASGFRFAWPLFCHGDVEEAILVNALWCQCSHSTCRVYTLVYCRRTERRMLCNCELPGQRCACKMDWDLSDCMPCSSSKCSFYIVCWPLSWGLPLTCCIKGVKQARCLSSACLSPLKSIACPGCSFPAGSGLLMAGGLLAPATSCARPWAANCNSHSRPCARVVPFALSCVAHFAALAPSEEALLSEAKTCQVLDPETGAGGEAKAHKRDVGKSGLCSV